MREATRDAPPPDAALRQRLQAQATAACLPADALQDLHPMLQLLTLTLLQARREALDAAYAQELMLAAAARTAGRRIVALESAEQQIAALLPRTRRCSSAWCSRRWNNSKVAAAARCCAAWPMPGPRATSTRWNTTPNGANARTRDEQRAWLRRLNDERNPALADGIDALHAQGYRVLAAVGALHMTGAQALPKLLAQRGYQVQRVPF